MYIVNNKLFTNKNYPDFQKLQKVSTYKKEKKLNCSIEIFLL